MCFYDTFWGAYNSNLCLFRHSFVYIIVIAVYIMETEDLMVYAVCCSGFLKYIGSSL